MTAFLLLRQRIIEPRLEDGIAKLIGGTDYNISSALIIISIRKHLDKFKSLPQNSRWFDHQTPRKNRCDLNYRKIGWEKLTGP
jgi:hypothetical protein